MLINRRLAAGLAIAALFAAPVWSADDRGSRDEVVALANVAAAHVKAVGVEATYADFTNDKASWARKACTCPRWAPLA